MRVELLKEDIARAERPSYEGGEPIGRLLPSHGCPVAQALRRVFPQKTVVVGRSIAYIDGFAHPLSHEARETTANWDNRRPVLPCSFTIDGAFPEDPSK